MSAPPRLSLVPPSRRAMPALALVPLAAPLPAPLALALLADRTEMAEALADLTNMVAVSDEVAGMGIVTIFKNGLYTWEIVGAVAHAIEFVDGLRGLESEYEHLAGATLDA